LGLYFWFGGVLGFLTFLRLLLSLNDLTSFLNIFPTLLFGLTLYSGYLLILKENEKGLEIGRAVIALQIIHFHIAGIGYLFVTGVYIFIGFSNAAFGINFGLDNTFLMNITDDTDRFTFRINVLALAIFIYLTKVMHKINEESTTNDNFTTPSDSIRDSSEV
jgi:hypothetical protein